MNKVLNNSLRERLGLKNGMHTYFMRAPADYWKELGQKPQPYDDNVGEYEFIHAFFTDKEEMSNFADILVSKLSKNGILWVSWPKLSNNTDKTSIITDQGVCEVFQNLGLKETQTLDVTKQWSGIKFLHRESQSGQIDFAKLAEQSDHTDY